ncbi:DUF6263 family protein [Ignavibacterium sp.]|uniref:DUF6263 family protein n=1 Tax=Ignavibacterium sp. TaxID=2651167 RepID=UPI00307E1BED
MRKYFLIASLFLAVIIPACGDKKSDQPENAQLDSTLYIYDSTEIKAQPIEDSSQFQLSYNFVKGEKVRYRLSTISDNMQTLTSDTSITMKLHQEVIYVFDLTPKEIDKDGIIEADINILGVKLSADVNGEKFEFEAGKSTDSAQTVRFAEFLALWNNPFSIRFNKSGEVLEVFRADKIANKFINLRRADTLDTQTKNDIKDQMVAGVLKPMVLQVIRKMPEQKLAKDSTWSIQQPPISLMVFQINYTNKYKIKSLEKLNEDRLAVIDAGMDYNITGNNRFEERGVVYNFKKPVSTGEGTIYFNIDKGRIQKSKTKSYTETSFTFDATTPQGKQKGSRSEVVSNTSILETL